MENSFKENIKIYVNRKYARLLKRYEITRACVFFIHDHFAAYYKKFDGLHISFCSNKQYEFSNDSFGTCYAMDNDIYCVINVDKIQKNKNDLFKENEKKNIFLILLHELGHALDLVRQVDDRGLERCHVEKIIQRRNLFEKFDKAEIYSSLPDEIFANQFAYKNLSYFENLYETEAILI